MNNAPNIPATKYAIVSLSKESEPVIIITPSATIIDINCTITMSTITLFLGLNIAIVPYASPAIGLSPITILSPHSHHSAHETTSSTTCFVHEAFVSQCSRQCTSHHRLLSKCCNLLLLHFCILYILLTSHL